MKFVKLFVMKNGAKVVQLTEIKEKYNLLVDKQRNFF
jgi:hypothetical protein